jgi:multiple sugar transport system permease protein
VRPAHRAARSVSRVALVVITIGMSLPILYLVSLSQRTNDDALNGGWVPTRLYWENWPKVFETIPLTTMLAHSWVVAVGAALLTVVVAVPAAYFTARARKAGQRLGTLLLASYCAPPIVAMLPLYYLLKSTGLTNSLVGLILVNGVANVPVAVWLLDGFVRRVPVEIEEAAWLDGLGTGRTLTRIVLPLIAPGLVAALLICLFLTYNEFLFAVSFAQNTSSQTLTVGLSLFQGDRTVQFGQQAAASLIAIVPMYVVAVLAQRWLVSGLSTGAVR